MFVARHLIDSAVGGVVVFKTFTHAPEQAVIAILHNPYAAMHGGGTQVEQETVGLENAMSFEEGMDHALVRDSSQRPSEHNCVERCIAIRKPLGLADLVTDFSREPLWQILACLGDGFGLRIISFDDRAESGETERETAVAATDLEDTTPTPIEDAFEREHFILFRIDTEGHSP
jgi:hypothetical protein